VVEGWIVMGINVFEVVYILLVMCVGGEGLL
jgi:hypothetical protein